MGQRTNLVRKQAGGDSVTPGTTNPSSALVNSEPCLERSPRSARGFNRQRDCLLGAEHHELAPRWKATAAKPAPCHGQTGSQLKTLHARHPGEEHPAQQQWFRSARAAQVAQLRGQLPALSKARIEETLQVIKSCAVTLHVEHPAVGVISSQHDQAHQRVG